MLGGVLADAFSYHVLFWLGAAMAVIAAIAAELVIPESPVRTPGEVDVRGAVILGVGLVLPLYAIGEANAWGWGSGRTLGLIARRPRDPRRLGAGRAAHGRAAGERAAADSTRRWR